jgi:stress response protein SCP2
LGWEARSSDGVDLDASAFMVGDNGKVTREEDFISIFRVKTFAFQANRFIFFLFLL